jgi:ribosomal protein S17E
MGRIKSLLVKRTAKRLLVEEEALFADSFEKNKKVLGSHMPSKPIRNKIAGYIARLVKMKKLKQDGPKPATIAAPAAE